MEDCLIVVDVQNDFMPGGPISYKDSDSILPVINSILPKFDLIIFTQDWHPHNHISFLSSHNYALPENVILWPDHCIQNTPGADLYSKIDFKSIKKDFYIFKKGLDPNVECFSVFSNDETNNSVSLKKFLEKRGVKNVFICGLFGEYSVKYTAIDSTLCGFKTYLIKDAIFFMNGSKAFFDHSVLEKTFENLGNNKINVISSDYLLTF